MKKGWEICSLDKYVKFIDYRGHTPTKTQSGMRLITAKNVKNGFLQREPEEFVDPGIYDKWMVRGIPKKGDVLFTTEAPLANIAQLDTGEKVLFAQRIIVLQPQEDKINQTFLKYLLLSGPVRQRIFSKGTGATVQGIKARWLKTVEIPVPPMPEQQRIVAKLDETFAALNIIHANAERNLLNSQEVFDLYLRATLSDITHRWGTKELGNLCVGVEYGSSAKSQKVGKVPVLRMGNIQDGRFDWNSLVYTSDEDEIEKYLLKHNDVLFNRTNSLELVGKTAIYKSEMPAIFAGYLIRIHRKEDLIDADYLNYFLNSSIAKEYGNTVVISSVNQANINGQKLKTYPVPLPPLEEQRAIAARLDELAVETKRLEANYQCKIEQVEQLRNSILQKTFEGGL